MLPPHTVAMPSNVVMRSTTEVMDPNHTIHLVQHKTLDNPEPLADYRIWGVVTAYADGTAVMGADIWLLSPLGAEVGHGSTDGDGQFNVQLNGMATELKSSAPGYADYRVRLPYVDIEELQNNGLEVDPIRLRHGFQLTVIAATASDSSPIVDAKVYIVDAAEGRTRAPSLYLGTTQANGQLVVAPLVAVNSEDSHVVAIHKDSSGWVPFSDQSTDGSQTVRVAMNPSRPFVVSIFSGADQPVSGATVELVPEFYPLKHIREPVSRHGDASRRYLSSLFRSRTEADGVASFPGVPASELASEYSIAVSCDGYVPLTAKGVKISHAATKAFVLVPQVRADRVVGSVKDRNGRPIAQALVKCAGSEISVSHDGEFSIDGVGNAAGVVLLNISASGFVNKSVAIEATYDSGPLDITLREPGAIGGVVSDDNGVPLANCAVYIQKQIEPGDAGARPQSVQTSSDGSFRVDGLPVGATFVLTPSLSRSTDGNRYVPKQQYPVVVPMLDASLSVSRALNTRGVVRATVAALGSGEPVRIHAAALVVSDPGNRLLVPPTSDKFTCADGAVSIQDVLPGRWMLWVMDTMFNVACTEFETTESLPDLDTSMLIGQRSSVRGRLDLGTDVAIDVQATGTFVVTLLLRGSTNAPSRGIWKHRARATNTARVDGRLGFLFDDVLPGEYVLRANGKEIEGSLNISVPSLAASDCVVPCLTVTKRGRLRLLGDKSAFTGILIASIAEQDQAPKVFDLLSDTENEGTRELLLIPGPVKVRVWRKKDLIGRSDMPEDLCLVNERLVIDASAEQTVIVPNP
jgi:hypothetical protein